MKIVISEIITIPNGAPATIASLLSAIPANVKRLTLQPIGGDVAIGPQGMVYATSFKLVANSVDDNDVGTRAGQNEIELDGIYVDGNAGGITMNVMAWD
ncbi:MAG TPA: hypothetical protein ENI05_07715 [Porticoccus sp.]|nr:hypothetical protein [Porticoccus sp.]